MATPASCGNDFEGRQYQVPVHTCCDYLKDEGVDVMPFLGQSVDFHGMYVVCVCPGIKFVSRPFSHFSL